MFRLKIDMLNNFSLDTVFVMCLLLSVPLTGYAKQEWEEIDMAELKKTSYKEAPEAPAVILLDRGSMIVDYDQRKKETLVKTEKYFRMKILNESGYEHTNIRIQHNKIVKIDDLEARTILPDGRKVKVDKKDFYENIIKTGGAAGDLYETRFTFPALEPGCIVEYKYMKTSKDILFLDKWYFRNRLYTLRSEFTGELSSLYAYNYYLFPQGAILPSRSEETYIINGRKQRKACFTWAMDSIAAIVGEPHSPPLNSQRIQISFALSEIRPPSGFGRQPIPVFNNWESVAKAYYRMYRSIEGSKKTREAAQQCTQSVEDKADKIRNIFKFVKETCKYQPSGELQVFPSAPETTLEKKVGDAADLSTLMVQLLRDAGLEAYPAVILTKHNPPFLQNFPSPAQFSKMIVYVFGSENPVWIDPASSFADYQILPWEDQGKSALIVNSESGSFSTTPSCRPQDNLISHYATMTISKDGSVAVNGWTAFSGLCREDFARKLHDMTTDAQRRKYAKETVCPFTPDAEITQLDIPEDLRSQGGLRIGCAFTSKSIVETLSDRLILNPALCHRVSAKAFESEQRENPIFFKFPYIINVSLKIEPPEGYQVERPPKPFKRSRPYGDYIRYMERSGGELYYQKKFTLPEISFPARSYPEIRNFYFLLESLDEEMLTLRKIDVTEQQDSTGTK